ncbi:integral membrane sensor signal transduction histidine kinase [Arcobacter nitrofigilis DSM 7299]|uniref:histidine kinase n=1 Tax=Arcobacter nitrofigilis (strain ATCC 33309 / DSM 7299 / CCUG 15893 / LMG 7604 / NCTC 12251 / CI) TaxID=572480 RepID=D5V2A9_ARCNC|nr:ArsS family sensor histidine kinase [Arcobacter nitrofigilis]ADG92342.1 integral membrane sensor signal transduction histidine kinase [Arcobacter nitrofigilis DSM 7299]|tara:strand:+ start:408 stop:1655 length:1248 start_codon:yes stop_codon:yes gene_type:complete
MKKESIFFTVTISFVISIFLVIASFIILVLHTQDDKEKHLSKKYLPVAKMVLEQQRTNGLTKFFVESLSNMDMEFINDIGKMNAVLYNPQTKVALERRYRTILVRVLDLHGDSYLFIKSDGLEIMFKDSDYKHVNPLIYLIVVFAVLFIAIILSFITTWKRLYPIKLLKDKVITLGEEDFDFEYDTNDSDEVSQLAIEFKNTAKKLKNIKESRNVFIRNIMHELKTPITKGKFLSELENSDENAEKMRRVFTRLESLINEFTQIEELISSTKNIVKNNYFLDDIIDNATDMLMLEDDVIISKYENKKLNVNFKLFCLAVKNLIDNAIKYSDDRKVTIKTNNQDEIIFENSGEGLKYPLEKYFEPFFANESKSKNSFGLGLYIVNSILKANNCILKYEYKDEINIFKIAKSEQKDK